MIKDPAQTEKNGTSSHVFRGGCAWSSGSDNLVAPHRNSYLPSYRYTYLSFRPVRTSRERTC